MASVPLPPPSRASSASLGWAGARVLAYLLPIGVGLAIAARSRMPATPTPVAAPGLAPNPAAVAADDAGRRLAEAIGRARASTLALEYGARDPSGRRLVATGVVVNDRGDVLAVRVDPPAAPDRPPAPDRDRAPERDRDRDRAPIVARDAAGHRLPALWVAADPDTGLTLLRVEVDADIRPIRPAACEAALGAEVLIIGTPYGLGHSVGRGHVAGVGRRVEIGPRPVGGLVQVQAPIHPGDSGALLADLDGGWLGVVRGGLARDDNDDLGFAIPARDALWVADQLRAVGRVARAYLGVKFNRDADEEGAEFARVLPGSPAELAGLRADDRVLRIDDQPVRTVDDLTDRLDRTLAGARVILEFARGAARETRAVQTGPRPAVPVVPPPAEAPPPPTPMPAAKPAEPTSTPTAAPAREAWLERAERLERRIEALERREKPVATP